MKLQDCTMCGLELTDKLACPACDAAEAIIYAGGALPHYHEALAEQIAQIIEGRNWLAKPINLNNLYPRFA
jgi:hypothetical protein